MTTETNFSDWWIINKDRLMQNDSVGLREIAQAAWDAGRAGLVKLKIGTAANTMTIQEAIKSGKPFRRKGWPDDDIHLVCEDPKHDMILLMETDRFQVVEISVQDILAGDWYTR